MLVLETRHLTKDYDLGFFAKKHRALEDLNLEVEQGTVFGLIGPNGAGKTTTIKILMGLVFPTSGEARILGKPIGDRKTRELVGYLPEQPYFYDYLSGRELLNYFGQLLGLDAAARGVRVEELLGRVGMVDSADVPLRKYSKGMTQRIGIAQALLNQPQVVFLDEPMSGLDPVGRREMTELVLELREKGTTVFFCSHVLPDVEALCDEVAILNKGRLVKQGRIDAILDVPTHAIELVVEGVEPTVEARLGELATDSRKRGARLKLMVPEANLSGCMETLRAAGSLSRLVSVNPLRQSLADYFVTQVDSQEPKPLENDDDGRSQNIA